MDKINVRGGMDPSSSDSEGKERGGHYIEVVREANKGVDMRLYHIW